MGQYHSVLKVSSILGKHTPPGYNQHLNACTQALELRTGGENTWARAGKGDMPVNRRGHRPDRFDMELLSAAHSLEH